jgi:3',5'-cyclic AMP phosphodiesterase CpdA
MRRKWDLKTWIEYNLMLTLLLWHLPTQAYAEVAPVLVGAGDIAECWFELFNGTRGAEATATLLDRIEGTVFTVGDHAYRKGTTEEFQTCYTPTWGRHKARTRPTPGNHDYNTNNAVPYYAYFGANAGEASKGYYSYDLGTWHIVALNSNLTANAAAGQEQWLREDLAAHKTLCTLAYWHHPVFSSGEHGNGHRMRAIWPVLYAFGVDVVINGHDHDYERFAPQTPDGVSDPTRGIREFVVGTGGAHLRRFKTIQPNSEVRDTATWGVLKLILHPASYEWEFIPVAGGTFRDGGNAPCVP